MNIYRDKEQMENFQFTDKFASENIISIPNPHLFQDESKMEVVKSFNNEVRDSSYHNIYWFSCHAVLLLSYLKTLQTIAFLQHRPLKWSTINFVFINRKFVDEWS